MQITFKAQSTRGTLAEAFRHVYHRQLTWLRILGFLLFLGGFVLIFTGEAVLGAAYAIGGFAIGFLGPEIAVHQGVTTSMRLAGLPTTFTLAADGVRTRSALADGHLAWPDITAVDELPRQLLLRLDGRNFLCVPTGDLTDPERTRLRAVIAEHRPAGAGGQAAA